MISLYFGNVLFFSLVYDVEEVQYVSFWSSPQRKGRVLSTKFPQVFSPSVDSRTENSNAKCTSASLAPVSSHVPPDPPHSRQPPSGTAPLRTFQLPQTSSPDTRANHCSCVTGPTHPKGCLLVGRCQLGIRRPSGVASTLEGVAFRTASKTRGQGCMGSPEWWVAPPPTSTLTRTWW